jgi:hypothetical protein
MPESPTGAVGPACLPAPLGTSPLRTHPLVGVIILMFWLFLSAFVVLVGAELNTEMELQTAKDTTAGPTKPMGDRDAQAADHVAEAPR